MNIGNFLRTHNQSSQMKSAQRTHEQRVLLHWKALVALFFVAVPVLCVTSFYLYRDIDQGKFLPTEEKAPVMEAGETEDQVLSTVVKYFETKRATFDQFRKTELHSVDPSL